MDYAPDNPYFAVIIRTLKEAADIGRAEPDPVTADYLGSLIGDGTYGSTQTAYLCADTPGPRDPEVFWRAVQDSRDRHPFFGPLLNDITPCAFWAPPRERPTVVTGEVPALFANATGDPFVPYSEALAMHAKWPSSRLITVEGSYRHGVYDHTYADTCVDTAVNSYLATGTLPAADLGCPAPQADQQPERAHPDSEIIYRTAH